MAAADAAGLCRRDLAGVFRSLPDDPAHWRAGRHADRRRGGTDVGDGMHGTATVEVLRDGFFQASLVALVLGPLVYVLFPSRTRAQHVDDPRPGGGNAAVGAAIRASVLMALSFWLYTVMQPSDMMMAVIAAMVLVFPTRHAVFSEAAQRIRATFYGCAL